MTTALAVGDTAPSFDLPRDGGQRLRSKSLAGKPYVLYFYPKDDTSGCTAEARDFTALAAKFAKAGVPVIGCSRDPVDKHDKFKTKHDLDVILIADDDGKLTESYGVWVEKSMYGRKYMGIERATFLVGANGKIAEIWRKVKVTGHAQAVLTAATAK